MTRIAAESFRFRAGPGGGVVGCRDRRRRTGVGCRSHRHRPGRSRRRHRGWENLSAPAFHQGFRLDGAPFRPEGPFRKRPRPPAVANNVGRHISAYEPLTRQVPQHFSAMVTDRSGCWPERRTGPAPGRSTGRFGHRIGTGQLLAAVAAEVLLKGQTVVVAPWLGPRTSHEAAELIVGARL
jgi:hypothetical protein